MAVKYILRTDTIKDEGERQYQVYGISAIDISGTVLKTIPDVFFDKEKAEEFVALCNSEKVELCHLMDVCEDQLN